MNRVLLAVIAAIAGCTVGDATPNAPPIADLAIRLGVDWPPPSDGAGSSDGIDLAGVNEDRSGPGIRPSRGGHSVRWGNVGRV